MGVFIMAYSGVVGSFVGCVTRSNSSYLVPRGAVILDWLVSGSEVLPTELSGWDVGTVLLEARALPACEYSAFVSEVVPYLEGVLRDRGNDPSDWEA